MRTSLTLLGRLRTGEPTAWDRFAVLYRPLLETWCRRWSISDVDRDDVVQDVLTSVFTHLPNYVPQNKDGSFRAWLRGIVRHKLLDWHRRQRDQPRGTGGSVALARMNEVVDSDLSETEDDITNLYLRAAEAVRGDFNDQTWTIFWRTTVENQPAADVARELGIATAAARMAKARVLKRLREEARRKPSLMMNAFVEPFIKSIPQESLDHCVIFGTRHLNLLNREYLAHYHVERPH